MGSFGEGGVLVSSWGHVHFEDDDALDYVGDLVHKLAGELDRAAAKRRLSGNEVLSQCIPRLAVLALLVRGTGTPGPGADRLKRWQTAFADGFNRDAESIFDNPADARRRWRAIERTIADLVKRAFVSDDQDADPGWAGEGGS
jgi:hypothetical protein